MLVLSFLINFYVQFILRSPTVTHAQKYIKLITRASVGRLESKNESRSSSYLVAKCIVFTPKVPGVSCEDAGNWG